MRRFSAFVSAALFVTLGIAEARADTEVALPGSSLEHALSVRVVADQRTVYAQSCRSATDCRAENGKSYTIPAEVDAARASVEAIELESGRQVALVSAPAESGKGRWILLLTASKKDQTPTASKSLVGMIEQPKDLEGERHWRVLLRDARATGTALSVGTRYEHADVCGRPSTMKVSALGAYDLLWKNAPTVSLSSTERNDAPELTATKSGTPWPAEAPRLLYGKLASSAVGKVQSALTDGDLTTRWAEGRKGAGEGEFLVMTGSDDVSVSALDFVLRPSGGTGEAPSPAIPRRIFVATRNEVFSVRFPDDAANAEPGTVFTVQLPETVRSDCFAVVLDEAAVEDDAVQIGIVEMRARTLFEGQSISDLVAALDDPDTADAAAALLVRNEDRAVEAIMSAYDGLSRDGRHRAMDVMGAGSCTAAAPFYVDRILGRGVEGDFDPALDPTAKLARDRLRRCRSSASKALADAVRRLPPGRERVWAARDLAGIAPAAAIGVILDVLADGSTAPAEPGGQDDVRRGLRASLATAARHKRAQRAVDEALAPKAFGGRSLVEKIDLLRAIGPGLAEHPDASMALRNTLQQDESFRTRYLLLEPASVLARKNDPQATAFLRRSLTARDNPHLRARAAEVSGGVDPLFSELSAALRDASPRVRRAALAAMTVGAEAVTPAVESEVLRLLRTDRWTFVRQEAARALARRPPSPSTDAALVATLEDAPNRVRVAALRALGERGSVSAAPAIQALADTANEKVFVRTAAIKALGDLCHRESVPFLYKLALRAGYQQLPYDQPLGLAALSALDRVRPPDMRKQLQPLLARNRIVPSQIRAIAKGILARRAEGCSSP
jgi:hypothetical protein